MSNLRQLFKKYWHILFLLYMPVYLVWFFSIEKINYSNYHIIHCFLDDYIPHISFFIIPYLLWFPYMAACIIFFFFYNRKEFLQYAIALITGMTICLIIYSVWPSAIKMRPENFYGEDIFSKLLLFIYKTDTPTNVFPSIHCLNSYLSCIAIFKCNYFKDKKIIKICIIILTILIVLSTVFLKQHSVMDALGALALTVILYILIYVPFKNK